MVKQAGYCMAKATTIAVRYSALRRQGFAPATITNSSSSNSSSSSKAQGIAQPQGALAGGAGAGGGASGEMLPGSSV
jgi:hypothetical protein